MKILTIWDVLRDRTIVLADEKNSIIITWDGGLTLRAFLKDHVGWVEFNSYMVPGREPVRMLSFVPATFSIAQNEAQLWLEHLLDYDLDYISQHVR